MDNAVFATTSFGPVRGLVTDGVARFLGLPYAAPPVGAARFAAPSAPAPWTDERDATAFGATAPQAPYRGATAELLGSVEIPGDDVLTANVFAPDDAAGAPVVLWIHGGAFERGTAALSIYDGTRFARDGVVFISMNYRLGSEGFSLFPDAPRNLGLLDAAAALRWVHAEIAAFGGDPERITIMGESAGGSLVAALLSMPASRALVSGAIIESGPLSAVPEKKAGRVTRALAKRLGIAATAAAFRGVEASALVDERLAQAAGSSPLGGAPGFVLSLSDDLPVEPEHALGDVDVPVLIGTNTDEYRLWFTPDALAAVSPLKLLLARSALAIPGRAAAAVRAAFPGASTGEVFGQLATDFLLRAPLVRAATARSAATYVYEFAWQSPVRDLRAAHALELGFVFDALADPEAQRMTGTRAPQRLADEMHAAWVRFIRTGDPGWPVFGASRTVRVFDEESRTTQLPRAEVVDALTRRR